MTTLEKIQKIIEMKNEAYAQGAMDAYEIFSKGSYLDPCGPTVVLDVDEMKKIYDRVRIREKKV